MAVVGGWDETGLEGVTLAPGAIGIALAINPAPVLTTVLAHDPGSVRNYLKDVTGAWDALVDQVGRANSGLDFTLVNLWWGLESWGENIGYGFFGVFKDGQIPDLMRRAPERAEPYLRLVLRHLRHQTRALHGGSWRGVTTNLNGAKGVAMVVDSVSLTAAERAEIARWAGASFYENPNGHAKVLEGLLTGLTGEVRRTVARQFGEGLLAPALAAQGDAYSRVMVIALLLRYYLAEVGDLAVQDALWVAEAMYEAIREAHGEETTRAIHQAAKTAWGPSQANWASLGALEADIFPEGLALKDQWFTWTMEKTGAPRASRHLWSMANPGFTLCGKPLDPATLRVGSMARGQAMTQRQAKLDTKSCARCAAKLAGASK